MLIFLPLTSHAYWISEIDKKYENIDPAAYAAVLNDRKLIDLGPEHGQAPIALEDLKAIVANHKDFAPVYVQLARASIDSGYISDDTYDPQALESSLKYLNQALSIKPEYDYAIVMKGFIFIMQGKYDQAETSYNKAISMHTNYPYIYAQLGSLEKHRGNYQKSIEYLGKGYELNKTDAHVAIGYINGIIGSYNTMFYSGMSTPDSIAQEDKWQKIRIHLDPNSAWIWGDYAQFQLYCLGDYDKAILYSNKALAIMDYGLGRENLALAYYTKWAFLELKKPDSNQAKKIWNEAQMISPLTRDMFNHLLTFGGIHYAPIQDLLDSKVTLQ
jgi:tetratricopeptide (TPR) repeat protein